MCNAIEQAEIFKEKEIKLGWTTLTTSEMKCITLFLTSSVNKEWEGVYLVGCHIQDKGLNILYHGLCHTSDVTINKLWLPCNGLTSYSSSLISELTVKCKVKDLRINSNYTIGEDQQLYTMLTDPCNMLQQLDMGATKLSSRTAVDLFTALKDNNKLKELDIAINEITDIACDAIIAALERNSCLAILGTHGNLLSSEAIIKVVQCLKEL